MNCFYCNRYLRYSDEVCFCCSIPGIIIVRTKSKLGEAICASMLLLDEGKQVKYQTTYTIENNTTYIYNTKKNTTIMSLPGQLFNPDNVQQKLKIYLTFL